MPSQHSGETVCTAGITEEGKWIRIYPIPFRMYGNAYFKKFDWIQLLVEKRLPSKDRRKESYRCDFRTIKKLFHLNPDNFWQKRRDICLKNDIYYNLESLINVSKIKDNPDFISLAVFKPVKILDLLIEDIDITERQNRRDEINKSFKE